MPAISIIMPVYKVEEYVGKTIESVLNQSFSDFEFFAVDDGSPDRSGAICDKYSEKDKRITVIHQKNQGAPAARNAALKLAKGKYVYFIDSDDWIEKDMLKNMYDLAESNNADLIITGFSMEYYQNGKNVTYKTPCPDIVFDSIEEFRREAYRYFNASLLSLPWNKLFLLGNIRKYNIVFQNTKWDDHHFCMDYLMDCKKVVMSSSSGYHWYRSRKGSETMINYSDLKMFQKRKEHFYHIVKLYEHWGINDPVSIDAICCYYAGRIAQCVQELADNKTITKKVRKAKVKEIIEDHMTVDTLKKAKSLSIKMKVMLAPIKYKSVNLSLAVGYAISYVRKVFPGLFIKLKEKEVHGA